MKRYRRFSWFPPNFISTKIFDQFHLPTLRMNIETLDFLALIRLVNNLARRLFHPFDCDIFLWSGAWNRIAILQCGSRRFRPDLTGHCIGLFLSGICSIILLTPAMFTAIFSPWNDRSSADNFGQSVSCTIPEKREKFFSALAICKMNAILFGKAL